MTAQILYSTMTGHSKKIALEAGHQTGLPVYNLKENPALPPCDILFIVSGIYGGDSKPELLAFAKQLSPQTAKQIVLLCSSAKGSTQDSLRRTLEDAGHQVSQEAYDCHGSFLLMKLGHPNKTETANAVKFMQQFLKQ